MSPTYILLYVTSANVDFKTINRFLLEAGKPHEWPDADYNYHVVLSRDAATYPQGGPRTRPGDLDATTFASPWIGASISEVEAFAVQTGSLAHGGLILVLDDEAVAWREVVLGERLMTADGNDGKLKVLDEFKKVRLPWSAVTGMADNLEVANMNFEEFTVDGPSFEDGDTRGGWYQFNIRLDDTPDQEEKSARQRERERLVEAGLM